VTADESEDSGVRVRIRGRELSLAMTEEQALRLKGIARTALHEPFTRRVWAELGFFLLGSALAGVGLFFVAWTMVAGIILAITFFGLAVLALSLRSARGIGGLQRSLLRSMLAETVEDPEPFVGRPGFLGWLQSCLRDRVSWRAVGYLALKVPWSVLGLFVAVSLWWDAFALLASPLFGHHGASPVWGLASAFFPSPFDSAAVLTMDGVGEWTTTSAAMGNGNRLEIFQEIHFPHSLGLLYSALTYYTGFKVNSGEYKVMGLAPYGEPKYAKLILDNLIDLKPDGSFRLDMKYFEYLRGQVMTGRGGFGGGRQGGQRRRRPAQDPAQSAT